MSNITSATTPAATSRPAMNTNRFNPGSNYANADSATSMIAPDGTKILTEEEIEKIMENYAQEDTAYDKTWTRIVVENILSKVRSLLFHFYF